MSVRDYLVVGMIDVLHIRSAFVGVRTPPLGWYNPSEACRARQHILHRLFLNSIVGTHLDEELETCADRNNNKLENRTCKLM
jgi:hypothetical protein